MILKTCITPTPVGKTCKTREIFNTQQFMNLQRSSQKHTTHKNSAKNVNNQNNQHIKQ